MVYVFISDEILQCFSRTEPDGKSCLAMNGNACPTHRGKVIGGSSTINGMIYVRGVPEDYNEWYRQGNPGTVEAA